MTSSRARPVLLALLGILAIALAAATLNSAVAVDGEFGLGDGPEAGPGSGSPDGPNVSSPPPVDVQIGGWIDAFPSPCLPFLASPGFLLPSLLLITVAGYALYRKEGPLLPVGLAIGFGPFVLLLYLVLTGCADRTPPDRSTGLSGLANVTGEAASGAGDLVGGGGGSVGAPSVVLLGVLAIVLIGAVALLLVSSDDRAITVPEDEEDVESGEEPLAIGRIAGDAADRIEDDAGLENEVFRAWHEMTTYLDVANPESSSPGEFADAAVDAGMDREDVAGLTRLFEDVRYGSAPPTDERERRAVEILRRIEETYAEGEP